MRRLRIILIAHDSKKTDLVEWAPYDESIAGSNGVMQISIPIDDSPAKFFHLKAN